MPRITFQAADVRRVVEHSIAAPTQGKRLVDIDKKTGEWKYEVPTEPCVSLVHDQGVYLLSNGSPGDPLDPTVDTSSQYWRRYCAYAKGCHPEKDSEWWDNARDLVGGDDFGETLPWARAIKQRIDAGAKTISIVMTKGRIRLV